MNIEDKDGIKVLIAERGKVFRRIGTNDVYGDKICLGYSYYIDGKKLDEPHLDTAEDFEEVDIDEVDFGE